MQHNTKAPGAGSDIGAMSRSMLIVMILTMVGKLIGFLRETVQASMFGVSELTDALKIALEAPNLFLSVIIIALAAAFIPAYNERLQKGGKEAADRFASNVITLGMALSAGVLLLTLVFIGPIIEKLMLPYATPETQQIAIRTARIMMPIGIFVFLSRMATSYLQANFSFGIPALSQVFFNVVVIGAIILSRGENILYIALGTLAGWLVQFIVQVPRIYKMGYRYRPTVNVKEPLLRDIGLLMLPLLATGAFDQLYILIRSIASDMAGHITVLDLSTRLSTMVSMVLLTTIATVLYPSLVRHVGEKERFRDNLSFGINLNLLLALPASAALIFLSGPITRLVYERGAFSTQDTLLTAQTLAMTAVGILGIGLRELLTRCFYAQMDVKAPTIIGILTVALNALLSFALYPVHGAPGIAIATSISAIFSAVTLLILQTRRHRVLDGRRTLRCLWKTSVASATMVGLLLALLRALRVESFAGGAFALAMLTLILIGIGFYVAVLWALRTEELSMALAFIGSKFSRVAKKSE